MSALTPALEIMFEDIKDLLQEASKYRREVSPLYVRDKVAELQVEVEEALTTKCAQCEEPMDYTPKLLCKDCAWELMLEDSHRDEVKLAFAATNGTL